MFRIVLAFPKDSSKGLAVEARYKKNSEDIDLNNSSLNSHVKCKLFSYISFECFTFNNPLLNTALITRSPRLCQISTKCETKHSSVLYIKLTSTCAYNLSIDQCKNDHGIVNKVWNIYLKMYLVDSVFPAPLSPETRNYSILLYTELLVFRESHHLHDYLPNQKLGWDVPV